MTIEYKDSKRIITSPNSASYWDFDGTNDYVQMPTIPTGYTFAVSMWLRKDSSGRMAFMVDNDTNGIWLEDANAGSVRLRVGHSQSGSDFDTSTAFPEDGNFHHLVFNVGTPNQIWLDGVSLGTGGTANSSSTNWIPAMGARNSSSTTDRFLDGAMSKVGIWNRKLTDAEVASLYAEAEPSTISSGLLATYNFEQTGNTLEDQTNSYDGTNNGATSGSTRDIPEIKPTDVQDNSLLVEKDTARRYWFSEAPVATDDYTSNKGYVDNTSDWAVPASGKIDFETIRRSTTSQEMYIDLQDSDYLGENLSDTNWTVRFGKFKVVNEGTQSGNVLLHICLSNTNGSSGGTQQTHSCQVNFSQSEGGYTNYCTTGNLHGSGASQQNVTGTAGMADGDERYIEMSRSGDDFTVKICSDANYSTVLGSGTQTKTGISGLRYLKFVNDSEQNASLTASAELFGGLEIINGASTWTWEKEDIRGLFMGGYTSSASNVIDYITIATKGNATPFGDLVVATYDLGACSSHSRGVYGGGNTGSMTNNMGYVTIATAGNATDFGNLTVARGEAVPTASNRTRGIWAGGWNGSANVSTIDYVTIDTLGDASAFGDLSSARRAHAGSGNSGTRGIFAGGYVSSFVNTIDYVNIDANPTVTATTFGTLSSGRGQLTGLSNTTRTLFAGGGSYSDVIDYYTNDTGGAATDFGNLTASLDQVGTCSSTTRGVMGGGSTGSNSNVIQYVTIAVPSAIATDFGDLTVARGQQCNGASGK
jgi:hypothetical protein